MSQLISSISSADLYDQDKTIQILNTTQSARWEKRIVLNEIL